jgi:hypothetical protein
VREQAKFTETYEGERYSNVMKHNSREDDTTHSRYHDNHCADSFSCPSRRLRVARGTPGWPRQRATP